MARDDPGDRHSSAAVDVQTLSSQSRSSRTQPFRVNPQIRLLKLRARVVGCSAPVGTRRALEMGLGRV